MADAPAHQHNLNSDPEFDQTYSPLIDFNHGSRLEVKSDDLQELLRERTISPFSRRAIVVANVAAFEWMRMFKTLD